MKAAALRRAIGQNTDATFGQGDADGYARIVDDIRTMAQKVATVVRTDTAPIIDGKLDDQVWHRADEMTGFSKWGSTSPADYTTRAWVAHDGHSLYLALSCPQETAGLRTQAAPRDGYAWRDDSVEIFVNPEMAEFPYVQFIITAGGAFFDQWGQSSDQSYQERLAANFSCEWSVEVGDDGWTAEVSVPLAELECTPAEHPLLRVDVVRNVQGADPEISAWFPSVGAHADPLSRGWVVFE